VERNVQAAFAAAGAKQDRAVLRLHVARVEHAQWQHRFFPARVVQKLADGSHTFPTNGSAEQHAPAPLSGERGCAS
jgi:hypothetical protein